MNRCIFFVVAAAMVCGCARLPEVKPITAGGIKKDGGIFYALPKTVITGSLTKSKYNINETCFDRFSGMYPELDVWTNSDILLDTTFVPDLNHIYYVDIFNVGLNNVLYNINYNDKNFITKSKVSVENMTYDVMVSIMTSVLKIAKTVATGGAVPLVAAYKKDECEKLYNEYQYVKQSKIKMLSELQSENKDTIKFRLDMLNKIEDVYLKPFFTVNKATVDFAIIPDQDVPSEVCYHIDDFEDKWNGKNVVEQNTAIDCETFKDNGLYLKVVKDKESFSEKLKVIPDGDGKRSYYYRVPGKALVSLFYGKKEISQKVITVNQFGIVSSIPLNTGGKKTSADIEFDETTGAIKSISMESEIIDPAKLQAIPDAISDVVKAAYDRELNELQRRRAILEEKAGIVDLQKRIATGQ